MENVKTLVDSIVNAAQEKKALDIVTIDMTELPGSICQYFIICEGNSPTQVGAITEEIVVAQKRIGERPINVDGQAEARWVGIDYGNVIVHIFIPELREFYDIEGLWADAKQTRIPNLD